MKRPLNQCAALGATLMATLLVTLLASLTAQAQITMEDRPYRAAPRSALRPGSEPAARNQLAADADDLPIDAPASSSPGAPVAPAVRLGTVPGSRATVVAAVPSAPAKPVWTILPTDRFVSKALIRWATEGSANGQSTLPILWNAPKDLPAVRATYTGDFLTVIEQVMVDSRNGEYPVHACAYDNLVRVLHTSQPCTHASSVARAQ